MNRYTVAAALVVVLGAGGFFLWHSSKVAEEASVISSVFLKRVTQGKLREAYHMMETALQKKYSFSTFAEKLLPLRGNPSITQAGALASWGWARVLSSLKTTEGRLFDVELYIKHGKGKERISIFRFGEHGLGVTLSFLRHIRNNKMKKAYNLMSVVFRKKVTLQSFSTQIKELGWQTSTSSHWEPVKQSKKALTHFEFVLDMPGKKHRHSVIDLVKEKGKLMIQRFAGK